MSRIGKRILEVPTGVTVTVEEGIVKVAGSKGTLELKLHEGLTVSVEEGKLSVNCDKEDKQSKSMYGTTNALISNMITGVSKGYEKGLEIIGVGYRFQVKGKELEVTANNAAGALEKINFSRIKVQGGGKTQRIQDWLVQSGDVQVLKSATTAQEELTKSAKTASFNLADLKSKWESQGVLVGEFKTKVEQLESSLTTVGSKGELDKLTSQIKNLKTEASQIADVNKIQLSTGVNGNTTAQIEIAVQNTYARKNVSMNPFPSPICEPQAK